MELLEVLNTSFFFFLGAFALTFAVSLPLMLILRKFGITRSNNRDFSSIISARKKKTGTPIMGGVAIVVAVVTLTVLFNWDRGTTYVPIGAFLLAAALGGIDDLLNIFGKKERRVRTLGMTVRLIRVHRYWWMKLYHLLTLPWQAYKRLFYMLGSHPGRGVQAHEKILIQLLIGVIIAWWLSWKLEWTSVWLPGVGSLDIGLWAILWIILVVGFMANAVNFTDGIDGLAAGTLVLSYAAFFFVALQQQSHELAFLIVTVVGALMAYLFFNIQPAKYQMGDVGSLGLGVLLAASALALDREALLFVVGVIFVIEIASVLLQVASRVLRGQRFLKMAPLHHHLEFAGWSESRIVMYAWMFAGLAAVVGMWLSLK